MKNKIKKAIQEYQCSGCMDGGDMECFKINTNSGVGCDAHYSGTTLIPMGKIFLGLPKGFCRLGHQKDFSLNIFEKFEDGWGYDMWNVPVWKYKNGSGHTLVRGISPRVNLPFLHIFLEDCRYKIDCLEISQSDVDGMD